MILLDTCALIWSLFESERLSPAAKQALRGNDRAVSIASLWEISIKTSLGKLSLPRTVTQIADLCESTEIKILPITPEECEAIQSLPFIHKDPFDRIIIAQAMLLDMPILTEDEKIWRYDAVRTIW